MLGRMWRGRVRLGPVEKMGRAGMGAAMWHRGNTEQVYSLHQDEHMQSRQPTVNVCSRVGSDLYASVMISFVAA